MKKIVKTVIVGEDSRKSVKSGVARGIIGGALLGPVGMIAGAGSAKNNNKTTFLVIYDDGSRSTETVKNGSILYKTYLQHLDV